MLGQVVMFSFLVLAGLALTLAVLALLGVRAFDACADRAEADRLRALQPRDPARFAPEMVATLPDPARRYFTFAIRPGTALFPVAEIEMAGKFSMGTRAAPGYMRMTAHQVLAGANGFVWRMSAGRGLKRLSGSDTGRWTRFRLLGLLPVARLGGTPDHARSAFGRHVAEAVFWTPAALLPGPGLVWEGVDDTTARVTVTRDDLSQAVDVTVAEDGRPVQVAFDRWTDANPERRWQLQRFGGLLSDFRDHQGFRLPGHVEAGNLFGTPGYFPFFIVDITALRFPDPPGRG